MNPFQNLGRFLANGFSREQLPPFSEDPHTSLQQEAWMRDLLREKRKKEELLRPLRELKLVSLDTETTGFHVEQGDEIIAVAAVKIDGIEIQEKSTFFSLVKPTIPIPSLIQELTGIDDEQVKHAPPLAQVVQELIKFIGNRIIVGYYLGHDLTFLNHHLYQRYKRKIPNRHLELKRIVDILFPEMDNSDLSHVLTRMQIPLQGRHTADGDAFMTARLWACLMKACMDKGILTLEDLYTLLSFQNGA